MSNIQLLVKYSQLSTGFSKVKIHTLHLVINLKFVKDFLFFSLQFICRRNRTICPLEYPTFIFILVPKSTLLNFINSTSKVLLVCYLVFSTDQQINYLYFCTFNFYIFKTEGSLGGSAG